MHNILPTNDRTDKMSQNTGPLQGRCTLCPLLNDDIVHALTLCKRSRDAANCLLKIIQKIDNNITLIDAYCLVSITQFPLYLDLQTERRDFSPEIKG